MKKRTQQGLVIILVIFILVEGAYLIGKKSPDLKSISEEVSVSTSETVTEEKSEIKNSAVTTPAIKIISPNGGEVIGQGMEYSIAWLYSGLNAGDIVNIGLKSSDESLCWVGKTTASQGRYALTPNRVTCEGDVMTLKNGGQYKAQINVEKYANGRGVVDASDAYFTIQSPNSLISVLSPKQNETYKIGSKMTYQVERSEWKGC